MLFGQDFMFYDIALLILFSIALAVFLIVKRKRVDREGIMFLYRTKWGIKLMNYIGGKFAKPLNVISYIAIFAGYILMISIVYLIGTIVYAYFKFPQIVNVIKVPPITPIFPYFTKVFNIESLFPPFYFSYFIIIVGLTMFVHEFSHGIYMVLHKIKIKSTGFAFFLIFPGAFVEQDEKQMNTKSKRAQMSVLSAGVFANLLLALISYLLLIFVFTSFFVPSGAVFNMYPVVAINVSQIDSINGYNVSGMSSQELISLIDDKTITDSKIGRLNLTSVSIQNNLFFLPAENLKNSFVSSGLAEAFIDSPSIKAGFPEVNPISPAAITSINNIPVKNYDSLSEELAKYSVGDRVSITVKKNGISEDFNIAFKKNPVTGAPFIGISFYDSSNDLFGFYKDKNPLYEPINNSDTAVLFRDFFWWMALINLFIALFNMLPVAILDGGRFFYLTILGITKSENIAKFIFKCSNYIILGAFLVLLARWFFLVV